MKMNRVIASVLVPVAALVLAACAKTVDSDDLENQLEEQLGNSGASGFAADCPDDEKAEQGNEFTCTLTDDKSGQTIDVIVTMTDDEGHFQAKVDQNGG